MEKPPMKRLMKRALSALVVIGALSACARPPAPPAAQNTAADDAKLQTDALAWFDLYNKGDADGVASLYSDDALLMPPGAPASKGRAAIREFIAADIAKSKAAGISLKNGAVTGVGVSGDAGWLSGTYLVVDASGATPVTIFRCTAAPTVRGPTFATRGTRTGKLPRRRLRRRPRRRPASNITGAAPTAGQAACRRLFGRSVLGAGATNSRQLGSVYPANKPLQPTCGAGIEVM
jgi:ketosteroid isomerase-like protein